MHVMTINAKKEAMTVKESKEKYLREQKEKTNDVCIISRVNEKNRLLQCYLLKM